MREKIVKRFYCDFCNRGMFKKPAMQDHEKTCILNPKRDCFMCTDAAPDLPKVIEKIRPMILAVDEHGDANTISDATMTEIRKLTSNCPACILSVLKQLKIYAFSQFDYKEEKIIFWNEKNREEMETIAT